MTDRLEDRVRLGTLTRQMAAFLNTAVASPSTWSSLAASSSRTRKWSRANLPGNNRNGGLRLMYFSDYFDHVPADGDWFDPLLEVDTQLFVDPFLVFLEEEGDWAGAQDDLASYFQQAFEMLAGHHRSPSSLQYKKTLQLMRFPEPREFGLGFVSSGTRGSGTGAGFAARMVNAMSEAIDVGLQDLTHFEELGVLVDRIGKDRISDIVCNILKPRFISYTQRICAQYHVPVETLKVEHAKFNEGRLRWESAEFDLPVNPMSGDPILLTPKRFLRELPSLDVRDWWRYAEPDLRDDLNLAVGQRLNTVEIIAIARRHSDLVRQWTEDRAAARDAEPYDVGRDPEGLHNWQAQTRVVVETLPIQVADLTEDGLDAFIEEINKKFKLFVEQQGGWRLLHNEDTKLPKRELSVQLLYKGVVQAYCQANNVILDREVELGRGPVDFIFTAEGHVRVLMEIKKMQNGKFWNGLEEQLTSYLTSGECNRGWFLAVRYADTPSQVERTKDLYSRTQAAAKASKFHLRSDWVDARPKISASEISRGESGQPAYAQQGDPEFDEMNGATS